MIISGITEYEEAQRVEDKQDNDMDVPPNSVAACLDWWSALGRWRRYLGFPPYDHPTVYEPQGGRSVMLPEEGWTDEFPGLGFDPFEIDVEIETE